MTDVNAIEHSRGRWELDCPGCEQPWYPSKLAGVSNYAGSTRCPWCGYDAIDDLDELRCCT